MNLTRPAQSYTATDWASYLSWMLDLLSLGALAATTEINLAVFGIVALAAILSRVQKIKFGQTGLVVLFGTALLGATVAWLLFKVHPLLAAAHVAPLAHSLIWFTPREARYRGWRIGMGFVDLILASSLTTDLYLSVAILLFVIISSVAISCNFLDQELKRRAPEQACNPLPRGFISYSLRVSFVIFLTSAIIFPLLPRTRGQGGGGLDRKKVGYSEEVNVSEWHTLNGIDAGSPILRIYGDNNITLLTSIYNGLLRGRVLESFDGKSWKQSSKNRTAKEQNRAPAKASNSETFSVEAMREPMDSEVLPVPYGAQGVWIKTGDSSLPAPRLESGEWIEPGASDKSIQYSLDYHLESHLRGPESINRDPPRDIHRFVPNELRTERMSLLAKRIFGNSKTNQEKIDALRHFYPKEGFTASAEASDLTGNRVDAIAAKLHPIERFLFLEKQGHCEWFASSAAILLRLAGVPTRVVAGFRITHAPVGGVLTIHGGDAHGWLEAWTPERGWSPLDPTPRELGPRSFFDSFKNNYEFLSAFWSRYVLSYSDETQMNFGIKALHGLDPGKIAGRFEKLVRTFTEDHALLFWGVIGGLSLLVAAGFIFLRIFFPHLFSIQWRIREGSAEIRRERLKMENLLLLILRKKPANRRARPTVERLSADFEAMQPSPFRMVALKNWLSTYHKARFGPTVVQGNSPVSQLPNQFNEFKKSA